MRKTLEGCLSVFNPAAQLTIRREVEKPGIQGLLVVRRKDGIYEAIALDGTPMATDGLDIFGAWAKPQADVVIPSRTAAAVAWLEKNPNATYREAARQFGVNVSAISRYVSRRAGREICPACNRVL